MIVMALVSFELSHLERVLVPREESYSHLAELPEGAAPLAFLLLFCRKPPFKYTR